MNETSIIPEDIKDTTPKYNLSKFEYDLYHDEDNIVMPLIRLKYFYTLNKGERWKLLKNDKIIFIITGARITVKCKNFLKTVEGVNFVIENYKQGIISSNKMKEALKNYLK
jgi:hypothetical protein